MDEAARNQADTSTRTQVIPEAGDTIVMVLSALLFAYFGFSTTWAHQYTIDTPPKLLVMVVVLKWALRGGAVIFGLSALLVMMRQLVGHWLFAIGGVVTAVLFIAVAIWDWTQPRYYSGVLPFLLIVFAIWNGYASWQSLRTLLMLRRLNKPQVGEPF